MEALRLQILGLEMTDRVCGPGYPHERSVRALAWVPTLAYTLFRVVLPPLASANVVQLLSLPLSALAAMALIRRWTQSSPWTAAALGGIYGLCPTLLATLGVGEVSNTQAWLLPLFLLAMDSALRGWRGLIAVAVLGLATTFTSPYYALALPLIAGVMVLGEAWAQKRLSLWSLLTMGVLAAVQAPALWYYQKQSTGGQGSMFRPAKRGEVLPVELPTPPPVGQLDQMLFDTMPDALNFLRPVHVCSIGVALLLLAAWGLARRNPGWKRGLALAIGGIVLCLGPALYLGGTLVRIGETPAYLPVQLLELAGWPTKTGGMYYRYVVLAVLGCTLLAGSALQKWRWGIAIAWGALVFQVAQGVWETGPHWPRPSQEVLARSELEALSGPEMGAVLELPFQTATDADLGQPALLRAVYHGHATTALPRGAAHPDPALKRILQQSMATDSPEQALAELRTAGISAVILDTRSQEDRSPSTTALRARLGEPTQAGYLLIWTAGPTQAECFPSPVQDPSRGPRGSKSRPHKGPGKAPPRR